MNIWNKASGKDGMEWFLGNAPTPYGLKNYMISSLSGQNQ